MAKRLFEAMVEANHRALAGDPDAGLHPAEYSDELPLIALTCVDARLNNLLPQALGVPSEAFIWLRNAGNIITGPLSSTMRSLALACAVKGGKEIVIIGHSDCQVGKTSTMQLLERFRALGVERHMLPDNLNEYFGIFSSDRQNVLTAVQTARSSPLIGPKVPVQGLLIDIETGKLEWLVNGYEPFAQPDSALNRAITTVTPALDALKPLANFELGEMKFPETKIGELAATVAEEIAQRIRSAGMPAQPEGTDHSVPLGKLIPPGFTLSQIGVPEKLREVVASIGSEVSQWTSHPPAPPSLRAKLVHPGTPPPKIPVPPPLQPKKYPQKGKR